MSKETILAADKRLLEAIKEGNLPEVQRLVEQGAYSTQRADVNVYYPDGTTPLYVAYVEDKPQIVEYLKRFPKTFMTASKIAVDRCDYPLFQKMWDKRTLNEMADSEKREIWNYAAKTKKNDDMVMYIAVNDVTLPRTLFFEAVQNGSEGMVNYLIGCGLDVNMCDDKNASLLHYAAVHNQPLIAEKLFQSGADIFAEGIVLIEKDSKNKSLFSRLTSGSKNQSVRIFGTPSAVAERLGNLQMAAVLRVCESNQIIAQQDAFEKEVSNEVHELVLLSKIGSADEKKVKRMAGKITDKINDDLSDVRKLALVGHLCEVFRLMSYDDSLSIYKEIAPKMDKEGRLQMEKTIRDIR